MIQMTPQDVTIQNIKLDNPGSHVSICELCNSDTLLALVQVPYFNWRVSKIIEVYADGQYDVLRNYVENNGG